MALTATEATLLGALSTPGSSVCLTVRQLSDEVGLTIGTTRRVLHRLALAGLVLGTAQSPARWRATDRGRRLAHEPVYRAFLHPESPNRGEIG